MVGSSLFALLIPRDSSVYIRCHSGMDSVGALVCLSLTQQEIRALNKPASNNFVLVKKDL